ncbi:MAG: FtsX-like permease family protein [Acidobacteria bacterium]|nr:FtsX-like permease family protein [Acidobacteriota bacterium]
MSGHSPPRWLERVVAWALPKGLSQQGSLGDLAEEFEERAGDSPARAHLWYALQTVSIASYRPLRRRPDRKRNLDLRPDFRWAIRSLVRRPAFALGVVAVLGLGLGANVAVFTVVDGTLANASWWAKPDRTLLIWPGNHFSLGQLEMMGREQTVYDAVGGYIELALALETADGESDSVNGALITPALFRELAAQPTRGRALSDDDGYLGVERVAVISDRVWRRTFGADPDVIGSRITVGGTPATVVGIQAAGGHAPGGRTDVWIPLWHDPRDDDYWKDHSYTLLGVLREDTTIDDASADLTAFTDTLAETFPMFFRGDWASSAHVDHAYAAQRQLVTTPLLLLLAGTALLVLVTALNVGNLLLGRAIERRPELAVRVSLGATRGRIVRQLLIEGMVLTASALALGLLVAAVGGQWIAALFVEQSVVGHSSVFASNVVGFALAVAAVVWVVLNGVPVLHYLRTHGARANVAPTSGRSVQRATVVIQAALATLLLVSAALLVVTVDNLRSVPLGFDPGELVAIELSPPQDRVATTTQARDLYERLSASVGALSQVEAVGLTGWLPLRKQAPTTPINMEDAPVDVREALRVPKHHVDSEFFHVLDVEPLDGRLLGTEERADELPSAVVINATLAEMLWPGESAVGRRIAIDPHEWDTWTPIVGVVPDIRSGPITGPVGPAIYVALAEAPARDVTLVVRTAGATTAAIPEIRRAIRGVDALVPVRTVTDMTSVVRAAYATAWVMMGLLLVLAIFASVLGAVGIYGVLAHHVSLSRKELAVRMALGARPGTVVGGVVRAGLRLATIGIVLGSLVAAISTRFLESLLYEVSALSPAAFVAPALLLALAAALAAWIPAARAGRTPPAEVLRDQ